MIIIQNIRYAFVFYIFSLLTFNRAELMKKSNGAYFPEEVCAFHIEKFDSPKIHITNYMAGVVLIITGDI